jgi:DNA repair photolyase
VTGKSKLDGELIVGPSLTMSGFCYSIFRLDPYAGCEHSCTYCYTRFLPGVRPAIPVARMDYPKLLHKTAEILKRAYVQLPPLRMSALTDPFQPLERKFHLSLELLRTAKESELPLILSTKSSLVSEPPWLDAVKEMADEGLAIVQISIAFLDDSIARKLEPNAPSPSKRLDTAERLKEEGVPVVLRLQPIVPFLNSDEEFAEKYAETAKAVGVRHVIAEILRIASWRDLEQFRRVMDENFFRRLGDRMTWERFPMGSQKHPRKFWRSRTYALFGEAIAKRGLGFGLCREGFYKLIRAPDCCGIYLLKKRILRHTLYEILHGPKAGYDYIRPDDAGRIPLPELRRKLLKHFELAEDIAGNRALLRQLIPEID